MKPARSTDRDFKPDNMSDDGVLRVNHRAESDPAAVARLDAVLARLLARHRHSGGG